MFRPLLFLLLVCGSLTACRAPGDDEGAGEEGEEGEGEPEEEEGPCPAAGPGVVLEQTGEFTAGGGGDGVVVLMGGAAEVDRGSARFVDGARGGDVLVLRASGSTSSYTSYFDNELADLTEIPARATATVRIDDPSAGGDESVLCRVRRADAVWLAGGDQSDYLVQWPAALHAALRDAVARGVAVGGTSAGAMSWSAVTFDAAQGGVTSDEALQDPLAAVVSVRPSPFAAVAGVVVDTHFQARDREGRLLAFVARAEAGTTGVGIDEGTALVIDGDDAAVFADDGGSVWFYDVSGVELAAAEPLEIASGTRQSKDDGAVFAWPPVVAGEAIAVRAGVVIP